MSNPYHPSQFESPFGTVTNKGITVEQYYALEMWKALLSRLQYLHQASSSFEMSLTDLPSIAAAQAKALCRELPNVQPTIHKKEKEKEELELQQDELPEMAPSGDSDK